jgi:allantoin racemase
MKLRVVMAILSEDYNDQILEAYRRWAEPETDVSIVNVKKGSESIESEYDEEMAAPFVIQEVERAVNEGIDGVIIFCFGDVAVHAAREAVSIPVIGLGEAAAYLAMLLGDRFSILSTIPPAIPRLWRKARMMGVDSKVASIRPLNIPVLGKGENDIKKALSREGKEAIADGADVIVLGCGTFFGMERWLEQKLGVPVVSCALAALKVLEMLVKLRLSHSKRAYPYPPEKRRVID